MRPAKLYLICLDAMPWGDDLARFANDHRLKLVPTFNQGTFTMTSLLARFTGRLSSDLVPGGLGSSTNHLSRFEDWLTDPNVSLLTRLPAHGWDVVVLNDLDATFTWYLGGGRAGQDVFSGGASRRRSWLQERYPRVRLLSGNPDGLGNFREWDSPSLVRSFYARTRELIQEIQGATTAPQFVWAPLEHFHDLYYYPSPGVDQLEARRMSMEYLADWQWDEEGSVFIVFSDHGHRVTSQAAPPDHVTWSLVRDNRSNRDWPEVMAAADCYGLALDLAGDDLACLPPLVEVPGSSFDRDRTFLLEDARGAITRFESVTAAASRISSWGPDGQPLTLTQLSWVAPSARYFAFRAPVANPCEFNRIPVRWSDPELSFLRDSLHEHVPWIDDSHRGWMGKVRSRLGLLRRGRRDRKELDGRNPLV